jgi:hypothetical protein
MQKLLIVISLIKPVIEAIKAVEEMFPQGGIGKEKLVLVRGILTAAYDGITEIWPTLEVVVARVVAFANEVGVFKK